MRWAAINRWPLMGVVAIAPRLPFSFFRASEMSLGSSQAPASFFHQEKTSIGATALQLSATSQPLQVGIEIRADASNGANFVYVGKSNVTAGGTDTTDGFKLAAGERLFLAIDDVSKVWVIGSTTGLAVNWIAS